MRTVDEQLIDLKALALRQYPTPFEKNARTEFLLERVIEKWREVHFRAQVLPVKEMNEVLDVRKLATEGVRTNGEVRTGYLQLDEIPDYVLSARPRMPAPLPSSPDSDSGSKEVAR